MDRLWTIGHSTRTLDDFVAALHACEIRILVDVRRFAGSRKYPHFNQGALMESLPAEGIQYLHMPDLGGRRAPKPDSHNVAWRNDSFRGYADYMETPPFEQAVEQLLAIARQDRTAIMCAEAVWWRCHRGLIADYLKARNVEVIHIFDSKKSEVHPYTSAARLVDSKLSYRGDMERLL